MARSTLIIVAVLFTVFAFVAADLDFWRSYGLDGRVHYHSNTLLTSFAIASRGEIELDEERGKIVAMEPEARLEIRHRRLTTIRRLEVRADASGQLTYDYRIGSSQQPESEARAYLASNLDKIVSMTTIGAEPRARRLAQEGARRVLDELDRLETNTLRRIYLVEAARAPDLDAELAARVIDAAGRRIGSSSQLRRTLEEMVEVLPEAWSLTAELARAAEGIGSSAERAAALEAIVRWRSLEPSDVDVLSRSVESIHSSSEKGRLIRRLVELEPLPALVDGMLSATRTIESSSERRRVLSELVAVEGLSEDLYLEALDVAEGIASSAEKADFLEGLVRRLPPSPRLESRFIEVASSVTSSVEQQRALTALVEEHRLSPAICADWVRSAAELASSNVTADLLVVGSRRCAAAPEARSAFLQAVEGLPSSADQRRALVALVEAADLDAEARRRIAEVADRAIVSASERQAVLDSLTLSARP